MKRLCAACYSRACAKAGVPDGWLEVFATQPIMPDCNACPSQEARHLVRDDIAALALSDSPAEATIARFTSEAPTRCPRCRGSLGCGTVCITVNAESAEVHGQDSACPSAYTETTKG